MEQGPVGPLSVKEKKEKCDSEHSPLFAAPYRLQRAFASAIKVGTDNTTEKQQGQVLISHFKDEESVKCKEVKGLFSKVPLIERHR